MQHIPLLGVVFTFTTDNLHNLPIISKKAIDKTAKEVIKYCLIYLWRGIMKNLNIKNIIDYNKVLSSGNKYNNNTIYFCSYFSFNNIFTKLVSSKQ